MKRVLFVGLACQGPRGVLMEFLVSSLGQLSEPGSVVCDLLKGTSVNSLNRKRGREGAKQRFLIKIPLAAPISI